MFQTIFTHVKVKANTCIKLLTFKNIKLKAKKMHSKLNIDTREEKVYKPQTYFNIPLTHT